jgi:lysophospholipase
MKIYLKFTIMFLSLLLLDLVSLVNAASLEPKRLQKRATGYAPVVGGCPNNALVRPASDGIGANEQTYFKARKTQADISLKSWLSSLNFTADATDYPSVGLTISGGGYRAMLEGGGVVQAFDSRDSETGVSGIFQSLTYSAGLSGGAWLLSSIAGNNWPTISSLETGLWAPALNVTLEFPDGANSAAAETQIVEDVDAKFAAGFPVSLTDPWGRLLSYQLFYGDDPAVAETLSGITALSNFTAQSVPYPIITSIETYVNQCVPLNTNTQFELHPYEFGSWDNGVTAFIQTQYLGTNMSNGEPATPGECVTGFDNIGLITGTSSNLFSDGCTAEGTPSAGIQELIAGVAPFLAHIPVDNTTEIYALYPNPFEDYSVSNAASNLSLLHLVDGGLSNQNNPIWPFIQPARDGVIDVLIVNDNSADTFYSWPNGTEIYNTYLQAQAQNLTRMPVIPPVSTFVSEGLNLQATIFGCNNSDVLTIIYLPNMDYTYASNTSTFMLQYTPAQTSDMIVNGNAIATQNGSTTWPQCLACAIMESSVSELPSICDQCFSQYCYDPSKGSNSSSTGSITSSIATQTASASNSGGASPSATSSGASGSLRPFGLIDNGATWFIMSSFVLALSLMAVLL